MMTVDMPEPSEPRKRRYHHGDLRSAMLVAAETVLTRDGLQALTLRAAAREAGVTHTAPAHHFGDLAGLLSALAASGFVRLHAELVGAAASTDDPKMKQSLLFQAYLDFARAHGALLELMVRSGRLDWSHRPLREAADAAFALLAAPPEDADAGSAEPLRAEGLAAALSRLAMAHGAAMLLLDGRLEAFARREDVAIGDLLAAMARRYPPA